MLKKCKKSLKSNGITLIALVITIIILLVLAGISIAILSRKNGMLIKAKDSVSLDAFSKGEDQVKIEQVNLATEKNLNPNLTTEDLANKAFNDLNVDKNTTDGFYDVSYSTSDNTIYLTYTNKSIKQGLKSSQDGKVIFKIVVDGENVYFGGEISETDYNKTNNLVSKSEKINENNDNSNNSSGESSDDGSNKMSNVKTLVQAFIDGDIKIGDYVTNYNNKLNNKNATISLNSEQTGFYEEDTSIAYDPTDDFKDNEDNKLFLSSKYLIDPTSKKTSVTQTYTVDTSTTWRILGLSEDKQHLIITTGSPIKKIKNESTTKKRLKDNYLYLSGAEGWYNTNEDLSSANNILDKICKIYDSPLASETRSINMEDINNALGLSLDKSSNTLYKMIDGTKKNVDSFSGFFNVYSRDEFYKTPEEFLNERYSYNLSIPDKMDCDSYTFDYTDSNVIDNGSNLFDVLFRNTTEGDSKKCYWVATSGIDVNGPYFGASRVRNGKISTGIMMFWTHDSYFNGVNFVDYNGNVDIKPDNICCFHFAPGYAVKPVVVLKSDAKTSDLMITSQGSEENW